MTFPKARLVVSACLFVGWIGFLFFLVATSPRVIVSRPQFLASTLYVTAVVRIESGQPDPEVKVDEVIWSRTPADKSLSGQQIRIPNLAFCGKKQGIVGMGRYVLPLVKQGEAGFQITPLPTGDLRVYPDGDAIRTQVRRLGSAG